MNEENAKNITTELENWEKDISSLIDSLKKDTKAKIDQKVAQASRKGRSSENCAKEAGVKFMNGVEKAIEKGLLKEKKSLEEMRRSIEDKKISERDLQDLKDKFSNDKLELAITNTQAEIEVLSLEYARLANSC